MCRWNEDGRLNQSRNCAVESTWSSCLPLGKTVISWRYSASQGALSGMVDEPVFDHRRLRVWPRRSERAGFQRRYRASSHGERDAGSRGRCWRYRRVFRREAAGGRPCPIRSARWVAPAGARREQEPKVCGLSAGGGSLVRTRLGILRVYKKGAKPLKRGQTIDIYITLMLFPETRVPKKRSIFKQVVNYAIDILRV